MDTHFYTQSEVTWERAFQAAYIFNDAFRDTFIREEYWPAQFLTRGPVPAYGDRATAPAFWAVVRAQARALYLQARSDPRFGLVLASESSMGGNGSRGGNDSRGSSGSRGSSESSDLLIAEVPLAAATLGVPAYAPPFRPADGWVVWRTLRNWVLWLVFKLQDRLAFGSWTSPLVQPAMLAEFAYGSEHCGANWTAARAAELATAPRGRLQDESYPKSLAYTLNQFAIASHSQGRGLGRKFLVAVVEALREHADVREPPNSGGPAKLELFSSPNAAEFYTRNGFHLAAKAPHRQPSGAVLVHHFFYMNLT